MKAIVIFLLVLSLVRIGARLAFLSKSEYPRSVNWRKADDVWSAGAAIAIALWCGYVLLT